MKPTSLLHLFILTGCIVLCRPAFSQNKDLEKKVEKSKKLLAAKKESEAEEILLDLAKKYPTEGEVWDLLVKAQQAVYYDKKELDGKIRNMTITVTDKEGNKIEHDTLAEKLMSMLGGIKPSETYMRHMINTCRLACCQSNQAYHASLILRVLKVDKDDAKVNRDAWDEFEKGEEDFFKQNYTSAAKHYQRSSELDSTFYKAKLYLGDVYYFTKHYDLAINSFKSAISTRPDLLEPRKYYFDALNNSGAYLNAYNAGIDALCIYPDLSMIGKTEDAATSAGIKCVMNWDVRDVFPNSSKPITKEKNDISFEIPSASPWKYYSEAFNNVKSYVDSKGVISDNSVTNHKYLEVYSWDYMLAKAKPDEFVFARKMKEKGMLDCYVFINCFHYDFYDQYLDFVASNSKKVRDYFDVLKQMD